ncbi:MAG: DUF393 domain-containing protein [Candidatus Vogelbacteria bacterium]|nr:DUF393 domain-containing protein [Candidatus Vogelbacteria bacterium]
MGLKIYYDDDCGICKKGARLLNYFALPSDTIIAPGQSDVNIFKEMLERNSWVVVNRVGNKFFGFAAIVEMLRHTKYLWPASYLLTLWPVLWLGEILYRYVATHRGSNCQIK